MQLDDFVGDSPKDSKWSAPRLKAVAAEICAEIQHCLSPIRLLQLIHREQQGAFVDGGPGNVSKLAGLFCFSSWLGPHIGDDAEVSVYSNSSIGRVYQLAAKMMPRLLLVAAMSKELVVQSMQVRRAEAACARLHSPRRPHVFRFNPTRSRCLWVWHGGLGPVMQEFMERWAQSEDVLSDDEVSLMEAIVDPKDRGPILFWLTNERSLPPGHAAPLLPRAVWAACVAAG